MVRDPDSGLWLHVIGARVPRHRLSGSAVPTIGVQRLDQSRNRRRAQVQFIRNPPDRSAAAIGVACHRTIAFLVMSDVVFRDAAWHQVELAFVLDLLPSVKDVDHH